MFNVMVYFVTVSHLCMLRSKIAVSTETCSKVKCVFEYEYAQTE